MKVLLVWEVIPDDTKFFLLDGEMAVLAIQAHGCIVNVSDPNEHASKLDGRLDGVQSLNHLSPFDVDTLGFERVVWAGYLV